VHSRPVPDAGFQLPIFRIPVFHPPDEHAVTEQEVEAVLARRTAELMRIEGVQGTGLALCNGSPCIRVYVLDENARRRVPDHMDGVTVSVVVTGTIRPAY
jgi:hypothetical protein